MNKTPAVTVSLAAVVLTTSAAFADFDFAPPGYQGALYANVGDEDRGVQFLMTADQAIAGAGIMVDPLLDQNFDLIMTIYNSDVNFNRGSMVGTATVGHSDVGLDFYGVGLTTTLMSGNYYEIAFDAVGGWGFDQFNMEFYIFNHPTDPPFDVGPFQVRDGLYGGNAGNTVMPHVLVYEVPAPGALALLGVAGLAARRRRRA